MRALVYRDGALTLERAYARPVPAEGEALVRVLIAGICNTDIEIVRGYLNFAGVLGHEFVGVVEELYGQRAREQYYHLLGKRVVGDINAACLRSDCWYCQHGIPSQCPRRTTLGIGGRDGVFAEYLLLPVENLHLVLDNVSDEQAVFVEPLAANFQMLEQVHIHPTDRVIVLGDGKMGQLAAQVLALSGCAVMMLGKHAEKLALTAQRGIETRLLHHSETLVVNADERVDAVVECTGSAQGLELALRLVRPCGTLFLKSTVADKTTLNLAPIVIDEIRVQGSRCGPFEPALRALSLRQIDIKPLISARYALDDALEAFDYAQQHGVLKVLLQIG